MASQAFFEVLNCLGEATLVHLDNSLKMVYLCDLNAAEFCCVVIKFKGFFIFMFFHVAVPYLREKLRVLWVFIQ